LRPAVPTLIIMLAASMILLTIAAGRSIEDDRSRFVAWKEEHVRTYATPAEETHRFAVFKTTLDWIDIRNVEEGSAGAFYAPDELADHTMEEFKQVRVGAGVKVQSCLQGGNPSISTDDLNQTLEVLGTSIDWEEKGAVTPVKNQGSFGTCWSFGSTGIMEGINVVQGGNPLESMSEQELIDCSNCYGYVGCTLSDYYIPNHFAPASEESYPYKGSGGTCSRSSASLTKSKASKVVCEPNGADNSQDILVADLLKYGPAGFLVDSSCLNSYSNGIISNCGKQAGDIDHATLLVGAGTENGVDYFRVKNSWGTNHGDAGYFRVKRSTNPPQLGVPGGVYGVYDGIPTPSPSPMPPTPTPVPPAPTPTPVPGQCHAISAVATDDWCSSNCAAGFCPSDLCVCDGLLV